MLGIKIRDTFLSLFDETAVNFEEVHPIGIIIDAVDQILGSFTLNFDLPMDGVNTSVIGRINRLDVAAVLIQDEYCEVWVDGILYKTGKATVKGSTNTRAKMFIIFNESKTLGEVALESVDFEGDRDIGATTAEKLAHAKATATNPLDYDYVFFPVMNPKYKGVIAPDLNTFNWQNLWDFDTNNFVENNGTQQMPFIRVDYLLRRIFSELGYTLDNQWQTTDELKLLMLYNNYSIANQDGTWSQHINLVNHVPIRNALDFVKAIVGTFALALLPDPVTKNVLLIPFRDLISAPIAGDWTEKASANWEYATDRDFVAKWRYDIDTNDDLSVSYSGVSPGPPPLPLGAVSWDEVLTALTAYLANDYGYKFTIADNSYQIIGDSEVSPGTMGVIFQAQDQKAVTKTGSDKEYISPLIPLWTSWAIALDGDWDQDQDEVTYQKFMTPHIQHVGYVPHISSIKMPLTSFRTMFYRGFQPADVGVDETYPMAGINEYNIRGEVVGDHSLLWDGDRGIFKTWWSLPYLMLSQKKTVTRMLNLSIRDLLNFSFKNKYRIENQNYFITRMRYTINQRGLSPVEATMITVPV